MDFLIQKEENFDEETYEVYDRNIRLWGKENQIKLNHSYVLLINLNSVITELAKNLVLAGVNLFLFDKIQNNSSNLVCEEDVKNNFFLNQADINKTRICILREKLSAINSYVKIEELESVNENLKFVQCTCIGFSYFSTMVNY
jgi:molybdopterin/thiamine biosynthesis adenylyltransferase